MRQHRARLVVAAASAGLLAIPLLGGAASAAPDPRVTVPRPRATRSPSGWR